MAKNAKSSKAKGRRLQNYVRDILREIYCDSLQEDDIKSQTMGMTGEDIVLSPAAREIIPFSFECKNVERLQMWQAIDQCETNRPDYSSPAVVFKKNGKQAYIAISFEVFCDMLQFENEGRVNEQTIQARQTSKGISPTIRSERVRNGQ